MEGGDKYPFMPEDATRLLNNYMMINRTAQKQTHDNHNKEDLTFVEDGDTVEQLKKDLKAKMAMAERGDQAEEGQVLALQQ